MADTLTPTSPLAGWRQRFAELPAQVALTEEPFVAMTTLWCDPAGPAADAVRRVLGFAVPTEPMSAAGTQETQAIWLGPQEWLVTDRSAAPTALATELRTAVRPHHGAAADVSGQRTTLRLKGIRARDILAKGCSIDTHPRVFRTGSAVSTLLGRAAIVLIALDQSGQDYRILVRCSFARYLAEWLVDAAEEFRTDRLSS